MDKEALELNKSINEYNDLNNLVIDLQKKMDGKDYELSKFKELYNQMIETQTELEIQIKLYNEYKNKYEILSKD